MGDDIAKGVTYLEGQQVNAQNLNAHVDNATIKYTAINSKALKNPASLSDELLINDDGTLKKITLQQIAALVATPSGTVADYAGTTAPTGWLMCYGQAISRITYSGLFTALGVVWGAGDGANTFNLPDCRGRVSAGKDDMGGTSADRLTAPVNGDILGAVGGGESHVLTVAQMPTHQHLSGLHAHNVPAHQHYTSGTHVHTMFLGVGGYVANTYVNMGGGSGTNLLAGPLANVVNACGGAAPGWSDAGYGAVTTDSQQGTTDARGSGTLHPNVQPTVVFNKIIKI